MSTSIYTTKYGFAVCKVFFFSLSYFLLMLAAAVVLFRVLSFVLIFLSYSFVLVYSFALSYGICSQGMGPENRNAAVNRVGSSMMKLRFNKRSIRGAFS